MILEILVLVISGLVLWTVLLNWKDPKQPKGPFVFPIFGNLIQARRAKNGALFELFRDYAEKYGKAHSFQFAGFPGVVLNDYKLIKEAWNHPSLIGRPKLHAARERTGGEARGLMFQDGDEWMEQRRFTLRHLRDFGFGKKSMESLIMDEVTELVEGFKRDAGKPISTQNRFNVAVLNALWTITTGQRFKHDDPKLQEVVAIITDNVAANGSSIIFYMPWLVKWFPKLSGWEDYKRDLPQVYNFLHGYTKRRLETYDGGEPEHFTDVYIDQIRKTTDPNSSFYSTRGELTLTATLQDLFFAGAETTSTTLTWACLLLATYPEEQAKVHAEIDAVVGSKLPSLADRITMPCTEAAIMEVLRFSALVPVGLFHRATETVQLGEYLIPKNSFVLANLYHANWDEGYWKDPQNFRSNRFLSEDGKSTIKHEAFIPFSYGKRICPGESLAKDELFLFLATILQQFCITFDPTGPAPSLKRTTGVIAGPVKHELVFSARK